jgi:hypothetical protein
MKFGAYVAIFGTFLAIGYGVLFSYLYPYTPIDGGVVGLCALLGVITCLLAVGIWKVIAKSPSAM